MSYVIDAVTLPRAPVKIRIRLPAYTKDINIPGAPFVVSYGTKVKTMIWDGYLSEATKTIANLYTDYVTPLLAKLHHEVTIAAPGTRYDGTWIFDDFDVEEVGGATRSLKYHMKFKLGGTHIVL